MISLPCPQSTKKLYKLNPSDSRTAHKPLTTHALPKQPSRGMQLSRQVVNASKQHFVRKRPREASSDDDEDDPHVVWPSGQSGTSHDFQVVHSELNPNRQSMKIELMVRRRHSMHVVAWLTAPLTGC